LAQHSTAAELDLRGAKCDFLDALFFDGEGVPSGGWAAAAWSAVQQQSAELYQYR
jgi:hypothetical protein